MGKVTLGKDKKISIFHVSAPASVIHAGYRLQPLRLVEEHTSQRQSAARASRRTHCKTLQQNATRHPKGNPIQGQAKCFHRNHWAQTSHRKTPQHTAMTATHCNKLQHTATHHPRGKSSQERAECLHRYLWAQTPHYNTSQHITTHRNTLQHTAPHHNTLQYTAIQGHPGT